MGFPGHITGSVDPEGVATLETALFLSKIWDWLNKRPAEYLEDQLSVLFQKGNLLRHPGPRVLGSVTQGKVQLVTQWDNESCGPTNCKWGGGGEGRKGDVLAQPTPPTGPSSLYPSSHHAPAPQILPKPSPGPRPPYLQGPDLLLGEVVGHTALGAQPAQAADRDVDELLELPALLQRPAGRGPCASLRGRRIPPATALLLLSHRRRAQRRSICLGIGAAAAEAGSPGRGRLGKEPLSRERWTRSAPRRCPSRDAGRAGRRVYRS
ncbi:PREDICTED: LOW QUALITY PROTEIN: uncharacterized protein LOC105591567 [Cercocebus atys]|uniref:LOW QUALITY PROTEIN: uncharacterized protein LOC105591567 n=1 Tax=Cercocebus atys TaxID=9531 RepID=UPI0005F55446|nr:PREDICTED: LOW QUALITY PROTEIN: uncharacterized protein LOC105591567 [Cercocebus atys]